MDNIAVLTKKPKMMQHRKKMFPVYNGITHTHTQTQKHTYTHTPQSLNNDMVLEKLGG